MRGATGLVASVEADPSTRMDARCELGAGVGGLQAGVRTRAVIRQRTDPAIVGSDIIIERPQ